MRWRPDLGDKMISKAVVIFTLLAICTLQLCDGVRRPAQRRKDTIPDPSLYSPAPSAESLQAIAQAMGAAGFETYTEGKALVKRLIPANSQPDLDVVEHQGVIGKAGVDFPALPNIPNTGFNCKNVPTGYYADLETDCQVFHICDTSRKISFLCPNGTIFSQSHLICDWWFKVDCASSPALYESSVEYYSNEQKKSQKVSAILSKNSDLQQIGTDTNVRAESRRTSVNVPSTTERLLRHRQRLQNDAPPTTATATSRSYQALFDTNPTQRTQATAAFEKRRKNLVQLIANNFGNLPSRTTAATYEYTTHRTTIPVGDYNSIREMQVAAETASFAHNQNRQYLQDFNNKNYRPYPVYNPNLSARVTKTKSNPTLTTLYDIRDKQLIQYTPEATSKRSTLVPYSKSYTTITSKHEPYTRPGVSLLKDFLEKEKNKSLAITSENLKDATPRSDTLENYEKSINKVTIDSKSNFESVTKIPQTTRDEKYTETASTDRFETYPTTNQISDTTTEPSYQERRERLMRKLNLDAFAPTQPTNNGILTEKYYGNEPNRPGLIVPPSLTPKTLHSLAIYYATALDNLSTTPPDENDTTTPAFDDYEQIEEGLPPLFSRQTINKYSNLFRNGGDNAELLEDLRLDPNGTYNELAEDLSLQMSQNPLATSPQIRELAQVFTHALSAYLQDPVQFRKVLSDIRPTHPSFGDMLTATDDPTNTEPTTTVNEDDEEILGFSDDHKAQHSINSLRDGKALNIGADYTFIDKQSTTIHPPISTTTTEFTQSSQLTTTPRTPFKCCGRISASYTTATFPRVPLTTPLPYTNTVFGHVNTQSSNPSQKITTDSYTFPRYGGFQNNKLTFDNTAYGTEVTPTGSKPLSDYVEVTNLPTAWGIDISESTVVPSAPAFESKKFRTTTSFPTTTPVYFTETDSVELENEEELQRAHSQSFVPPQSNSVRHGKQLNIEEKPVAKKPSEDLEAPSEPNVVTTTSQTTTLQTTTQSSTTIRDQNEALTTISPILSSIFTSPDSEKTSNDFQWPTTFDNWQSTIVDPITLNDGLSPSGHEQGLSQIAQQTNTWAFNTATTPTVQYTTAEPLPSSTVNLANVDVSTPRSKQEDRIGRLLRDPTSTEAAQDLTTITDTVVEKAKEIMGGMNATTTEKLMNVMKKTKSKTVKRLILLLVQTCDDDHNSTAEASKKALLEALMAVSQKDMEEIAQEEGLGDTLTTASDTEVKTTVYQRRMDRIPERESFRRGKSLKIDPKAINSLSNPTTEALRTEETEVTTTLTPRTTVRSRGGRRFQTKTTEQPRTPIDRPIAEARVAPQGADVKTQSDTRAIELLRSLYTIAARWG